MTSPYPWRQQGNDPPTAALPVPYGHPNEPPWPRGHEPSGGIPPGASTPGELPPTHHDLPAYAGHPPPPAGYPQLPAGHPPPPAVPPQLPAVPPQVYTVAVVPRKSTAAAVALELIPAFFGVFGIGNIYAGRIGLGITLMVSFWLLFWVNVALLFVLIGLVTMPLTWIGYLGFGTLLAVRGVAHHNARDPLR